MDGKACSQQPSLCSPHPSSPADSSPPRNPALRCPSRPSPRQLSSQLTSPTYVLDPVYFLGDSVSALSPKQKAPRFLGALFPISIFYFPISKPSVSPAFLPWCSPASALSGTPAS